MAHGRERPQDALRPGRRGWTNAKQTRQEAERAALELLTGGRQGGVGVVLGRVIERRYLCGIDLDTCRNPEGELEPWAATELELFGTYAEISPSGGGAKAFFLMEEGERRAALAALGQNGKGGQQFGAVWKRNNRKHAPGVELYLGGRWFAVTGDRLESAPPAFARPYPPGWCWG